MARYRGTLFEFTLIDDMSAVSSRWTRRKEYPKSLEFIVTPDMTRSARFDFLSQT